MPKKQTATFRVEEGKLRPRSKAKHFWEGLHLFEAGRVVVTFETETRSLAQNRFLWGYVYRPIRIAMLEAGQPVSSKAIHEHYKQKYLDPEVHQMTDPVTGEVTEYLEYTTTDLSTTEFSDYIERIKQDELVIELGCLIPEPGDDVELVSAA